MASSPLEAGRTMDALMALDAVHVLGNHDRWLIERPPEKLGAWDQPAYAQLDKKHLDWLRTIPPTQIFRDQVFLCHGTPGNDDLYWLETVTSDGSVTLSAREAIEKEAEGISQSLILCAHTHIARAVRLGDGRMVVNPGSVGVPGFSYNVPVSASDRGRHAGRALRHPGTGRQRMARDLPACALRSRSDGGNGAQQGLCRIRIRAGDGVGGLRAK